MLIFHVFYRFCLCASLKQHYKQTLVFFLTFSAGEGGGDVLKPRAKGTCDAKTLENSHVEPKNGGLDDDVYFKWVILGEPAVNFHWFFANPVL